MANITVGYSRYNRDLQKQRFPKECDNYYKDVDGWGTRIEPRLDNWIELRDRCKKQYEDRKQSKGNEDENAKNKRIQEKHYYKMHYDYWKDKVERFEAEEVKDSWARRQLVDTQMVSKYAREFLKTYFSKVSVQKGTTTSAFRKIFGFQEEDEIKSRNQHTHHAIDALVLTLIPTNSRHRERILKEYYAALELDDKQEEKAKIEALKKQETPVYFNSQKFIKEIENSTLIYNYENDKIIKQTNKVVRKRGIKQYLKDKNGKYVLNNNGKKILLRAKGDTVRSGLYAQTYLGKIHDVERFDDGQPKRENGNGDWKYKTGKDEFCFVKRENIDKVKASDSLIASIIDPVIRELVKQQKNNAEIKDYQGKIIRHVRIRVKTGKEVKERVNYRSKHDYKNKFYAEAGSIPYAILLQKFNKDKIKREMLPIASYEIAQMYKKAGKFDIEKYVKDKIEQKELNPEFANWHKQLLKVGQKVFVLKDDTDFEKQKNIDFQRNRLYVITQFKYDGSKIMLQYHLEAQTKSDIDEQVKSIKDSIIRKKEDEFNIPLITENENISNVIERKKDYQKRLYDFTQRLKVIEKESSVEVAQRLKVEIEQYKTESSVISVEGKTPILGLSRNNWNFLFEGKDFEMNIDGSITFNSNPL
jgi:CRISPR-associated endonuclease Csn1